MVCAFHQSVLLTQGPSHPRVRGQEGASESIALAGALCAQGLWYPRGRPGRWDSLPLYGEEGRCWASQ